MGVAASKTKVRRVETASIRIRSIHRGKYMNHGLRFAALAIVLSSVSFAMAADPAREAAGWKNWADFTENVAANVGEDDYNANGVKNA